MLNLKYLLGLIMIVCVVWLTMILCFIIIYFLLSSIELSTITYIDKLILNAMWALLAGFIFLGWLYSWNMLVKLYFQRNLNQGEMKRKEPSTRRKKVKTRVSHTQAKSIP